MIYLALAFQTLAMLSVAQGRTDNATMYAIISVSFAVLQVAQTVRDKDKSKGE